MKVEILQVGLALLVFGVVFGLVFGSWVMRRKHADFPGFWPLAWAILMVSAVARLGLPVQQVDLVVGTLFASFMLAGACRYAGREIPRWLIPAGFGLGATYLSLDYFGYTDFARLITLAIEPSQFAGAAYVVYAAPTGQRRARLHMLLAPGFLCLLGLDLFDWFSRTDAVLEIGIWLVVAIPILIVQAASIFERIHSLANDSARALEESISLLQATLESTADGILVVDRDGNFISFNRRFAEMWKIPEAILDRGESGEALESAMGQLKDPNAFFEKVQALYANPTEESFDTLEFKNGRVLERFSRPQRVGQDVVGRVWSFRDVTQRHLTEAVVARHQNHLEELVADRTRELLESRDRLLQADRLVAVGTLAAGIAHQINNPIGSILNSAEYALLCEDEADSQEIWKRALQVHVEEARRCAAIVRSMLQFSRAEPVDKHVDDLHDVVRRAARVTTGYAKARDADVEIERADSPLWVEMSSIEIEQVMVNLIRNAIESRVEGGVRVTVHSEAKDGFARVFVCDNGRGINSEDVDRVFDPFFSTRLQEGGTGLGLSVAHGIVIEHGGTIYIERDVGRGTSIVVELPLATNLDTDGC